MWLVVTCTFWLATPLDGFAQGIGDSARAAPEEREESSGRATQLEFVGAERIGTLGQVIIECTLPECDDPDFVEALERTTGLDAGESVDGRVALVGADRLSQTMFFVSIAVSMENGAEGIDVRYRCEPATVIRRMRVRSGLALASEVRRRVFLRSGQWWLDDPQTETRQREAIQEYFRSNGFFGSSLTVEVEPVDEYVVDLRFRADRGERRTVGNFYFLRNDGDTSLRASSLSYEEVRDIVVGEFNLLRTFTTRNFQRAQDALLESYRERGYIQARILLDATRPGEAENSVDLFLSVREGAPWDIRFSGNRLFSSRELLESLTFFQTGFVDAEEIRLGAAQLQTRYETAGHFFAGVSVNQQVSADGTQTLVYQIDEGPAAEIRSIRFDGVTAFEEGELRALMGTRVYDVLSPGGYLQRSLLQNDLDAIVELYRHAGYLDAAVTRVVFLGENNGEDLHVNIFVREGPRTYVGEIDLGSAQELRRRVRRSLRLQPGAPFDEDLLDEDESRLVTEYHRQGYPFVQVERECVNAEGMTSACESEGVPATCRRSLDLDRAEVCERSGIGGVLIEECRLIATDQMCAVNSSTEDRTVDLRYEIERGAYALVEDVFLRGNFRTRDNVILRELELAPGDPYQLELLLASQSNIRSLRLFDSVRAQPIWTETTDAEETTAALLIQVEEARSRFIEHRIGLESRVTPTSDLLFIFSNEPLYRDANFLGRAEELRILGNFDIDIVNRDRVSEGEFRASIALIYFDPRFTAYGALDDAWEQQTEVSYRYDLLAVPPAPLRKVAELATRFREEFDKVLGLFFELGFSLRQTAFLDQSNPAVVNTEFDEALILSMTPRVTYDRRDNPLNPSRGTFTQLEIEFADDLLGVLSAVRFTKLTARTSLFVPLGARFVLGTNVRTGVAVGGITQGFRADSAFALPLSDRYALGGVTTLRGFAEGQVSSIATDEFGGDVVLNGNLELRYPFLSDLGLNGAIFVDTGQIARDLDELRGANFRTTTGFGLRWLIADLIPLVLDYGVVIGRRPGERFGRLHFNIGYTF